MSHAAPAERYTLTTTTAEDASERRRRFQLFADHGVPVERNPYTPALPQ